MVILLKNTPLTLLNPRRHNFDVHNPLMEEEQIEWEHRHLEKADHISFWFPAETLCPITLFELGKYAQRTEKILFIGAHPEYKRVRDIHIQIGLIRPEIKIVSSLQELCDQIQQNTSKLLTL
jgi:Nucleoside 2-deoxyribosyltransferase like